MPPDLLRALENKTWQEASSTVLLEISRNAEEVEKAHVKIEAVEAIVQEMRVKIAIIVGLGSAVGTALVNTIFEWIL